MFLLLILSVVTGQTSTISSSGQAGSYDGNDSWATYRDPMCDVDHGCKGDDNACWYQLSLMRVRPYFKFEKPTSTTSASPNSTLDDAPEVGQSTYGFPRVDLHKVPCGGLRGNAEFVTVDAPDMWEGKDVVDGYFGNMWVTAKDQFDKNFRRIVSDLDYSNMTEHTFNADVVNALTAAVGMDLGPQDDETMNKIYIVKTSPKQADPNKSWNKEEDKIPIEEVPEEGKGVFRPCGQSYDLKQSHCDYDQSAPPASPVAKPTSDPNGWEGRWYEASWETDDVEDPLRWPFPFTSRGWTFDWFGYKKYLASGCSEDPKLMVGPSEMVVTYGTSIDIQNDKKAIYPLEHACNICFPLRCGVGFHSFANKNNMCK